MIGRVPDRSRQVARIVTRSPHGEFLPVEGLADFASNCVEAHGEAGLEAFDLFL